MVHHVRSKTVIGIINRLSLILGLASLCSWIYFNVHSGIWCQIFHPNPLLMVGLFLLAVSVLKYITTWYFRLNNNNLVTYVYLFCMFMLIIIIIVGTGMVLIVTQKRESTKKYIKSDVYSSWIWRNFEWDRIQRCLIHSQVCTTLGSEFNNLNASEIFKKKLPLIQSSCCIPPSYCYFKHKKANSWAMIGLDDTISENFWILGYHGFPNYFPDCNKWRNNPAESCYYCRSCIVGVLENIRMEWRHLAMINICVFVFVIIVHYIHWCITRNIELNRKYSGYRVL